MECPYNEVVHCQRTSMIAGKGEETITLTEMRKEGGILGAFADDHDIQQITVVSTNIGFVRIYTKRFKDKESTDASSRETIKQSDRP